MPKNSTISPLRHAPLGLILMVLLAIVIIFFVNKHFDNKIKMLRQQSSQTAAQTKYRSATETNTS